MLTVGIDTGSFRFGYSYDITISKLTNISGGSHELSLEFDLQCRKHVPIFKTLTCPSF